METAEAIRTRRAVKRFDPEHRLTDAEEKELFDLVLQSPTAFNIQNWRFVVVRDPELRQQIREIAWDQPQVTESSLFVVLCADLKAWAREPQRYWVNAPKEVQDIIVPGLQQYYTGQPRVERDEAHRSCGMAGQTLMLAAKAMGYDSCPMDGFDYAAMGRLLNLPDDHIVSFAVAVGRQAQAPWPRPGQLPAEEVILTDRFPAT